MKITIIETIIWDKMFGTFSIRILDSRKSQVFRGGLKQIWRDFLLCFCWCIVCFGGMKLDTNVAKVIWRDFPKIVHEI